ncbi:hypothetical protein BC941DRAFT_499397 [Chlamydoabsidia padenii]|nr:hypothetical protein BC941DRAFT_499397 [Chlamydoabsidia padenii]
MLSRFNLLARKELLKGDCRCRQALVNRLYTTTSSNDKSSSPLPSSATTTTTTDDITGKPATDAEIANDDHFWEVPSSKPPVKRRVESLDFRRLLDDVLKEQQDKDNKYITKGIAPSDNEKLSSPRGSVGPRRAVSLIEHRLLEMVSKHKQIYKRNSPLPRSMMSALYGKTMESNTTIIKKTLDPAQLEAIQQNKAIQSHDREIKIIDDLLSTTTRKDLLNFFTDCVTDYQRRQAFPTYYPRLVKNAIHHAFINFTDPYLAVALFEQCKTMSIQSYIEGCTVEVYNQVLQLRWNAWEDIYGMLDLMEEMTLNGIAFDAASAGIVQTITDEMERQQLGSDKIQRWSPDDVRSTELMKILVAVWIV